MGNEGIKSLSNQNLLVFNDSGVTKSWETDVQQVIDSQKSKIDASVNTLKQALSAAESDYAFHGDDAWNLMKPQNDNNTCFRHTDKVKIENDYRWHNGNVKRRLYKDGSSALVEKESYYRNKPNTFRIINDNEPGHCKAYQYFDLNDKAQNGPVSSIKDAQGIESAMFACPIASDVTVPVQFTHSNMMEVDDYGNITLVNKALDTMVSTALASGAKKVEDKCADYKAHFTDGRHFGVKGWTPNRTDNVQHSISTSHSLYHNIFKKPFEKCYAKVNQENHKIVDPQGKRFTWSMVLNPMGVRNSYTFANSGTNLRFTPST